MEKLPTKPLQYNEQDKDLLEAYRDCIQNLKYIDVLCYTYDKSSKTTLYLHNLNDILCKGYLFLIEILIDSNDTSKRYLYFNVSSNTLAKVILNHDNEELLLPNEHKITNLTFIVDVNISNQNKEYYDFSKNINDIPKEYYQYLYVNNQTIETEYINHVKLSDYLIA